MSCPYTALESSLSYEHWQVNTFSNSGQLLSALSVSTTIISLRRYRAREEARRQNSMCGGHCLGVLIRTFNKTQIKLSVDVCSASSDFHFAWYTCSLASDHYAEQAAWPIPFSSSTKQKAGCPTTPSAHAPALSSLAAQGLLAQRCPGPGGTTGNSYFPQELVQRFKKKAGESQRQEAGQWMAAYQWEPQNLLGARS